MTKHFALILALAFGLNPIGFNVALANDGSGSISSYEERLFHHNFAGQTTAERLDRLELSVFGEKSTMADDQRLERLAKVMEAAPVLTPVALASSAKSESVVVDDDDCAIQRAQVMVKASQEEQTTKLLSEGVSLFRQGNLVEARDKFEQVLRMDPNNPDANFSLGIIDEGTGCLTEALSSYRKAASIRPDKTEYRDAVAQLQDKIKQFGTTDTRKVQVKSLANTAMQAYMRGEYQAALNIYLTLDQKAPNQAIVKSNLATVYLAMKQPEKAAQYYKQAVELNPYDERFKKGLEQAEEQAAMETTKSLEDRLNSLANAAPDE